ncbi:MAG: hypothetical protein K2O18_10285, partial [Oscillospiraceae bacterium]|nr:hypothetical protein [Oscillospiraceae bacterium]
MIDTNALPAKLRETGLFCCWRYEERDGKKTKVPYNPRTGGRAQSTNPQTFAPLSEALDAAELGRYDGIGVGIFGTLGAIDIDHCLSDSGELSELAADVMNTMQGYTEYSPSGKGLRILFTVPRGFQYDKARYYINNQKVGLEIYIAGCTQKYVTVTGNALTSGVDLEDRGEQLRVVLEKYMVRSKPKKNAAAPIGGSRPVTLDDAALIEKIRRSKNGAAFSSLWAGDISGYKSHSEEDIALCNQLAFWTNKDADRMDRLFRQSGLYREDKWDRRQSGSTYGALTIQNAVNTAQRTYDPEEYKRQKSAARDFKPTAAQTENQPVKPPDYSDAGNAVVFSRVYRDDLIFVDALGWLWWTGKKWERDDHKAVAWALDLSERMLKEALDKYGEAQQLLAEAMTSFAETGDDEDKDAIADAKEAVKKAGAYLAHAKTSRNA